MKLAKEEVMKLAENENEVEICKMVTIEIADQFSEFLDNYQKMITQYPLVRASTCLVAQLRIAGKPAATSVTGMASEVKKCMLALTKEIFEKDRHD